MTPDTRPAPVEVPPSNVREALEDFLREMAIHTTRADVVKNFRDIDPARIVHATQGSITDQPLSGFELAVATVIDQSVRNGILTNPLEAVAVLAGMQSNFQHGRSIFVGQVTPKQTLT